MGGTGVACTNLWIMECTDCGEEKLSTDFYKSQLKRVAFGKKARCNKCSAACVRAWRKNNPQRSRELRNRYTQKTKPAKVALLVEAKSLPCVDCGKRYHKESMDLDHRDSAQKKRKVSSMTGTSGSSVESVRAEIGKCDLVCANCHRLRTLQRKTSTRSSTNRHTIKANRRRLHLLDFVNTFKSMPCADCATTYLPFQMDFDHRAGVDKIENVSELVKRRATKDIIVSEIAKCDLVCANCHRTRTAKACGRY